MAEANKSGIFAKAQKRISRTKTKVLQTLGKAGKYTDETFDDLVQKTEKQHDVGHHLQKEFKSYVNCMRALSNSSKSLAAALSHTYEEEWTDEMGFKKLLEAQDLLWTDYIESVQSSVMEPVNTYLASFPTLKVKTAKRGRKMVDFDNARHNLEVLQAAKKKDDSRIAKAQEDLTESKKIFEELHSELCTELPNFYNSRVTFYADLFQKMFNCENTLHSELAKLSQGLSETSERLSKDHVQFVYTPKRPLSKSLSDKPKSTFYFGYEHLVKGVRIGVRNVENSTFYYGSDEQPVNGGDSSPRPGTHSPASSASPAATPTTPTARPRTSPPSVVAAAAAAVAEDGERMDENDTDHVYGNQEEMMAAAKVNGDVESDQKTDASPEDTATTTFTSSSTTTTTAPGKALAEEGGESTPSALCEDSESVRVCARPPALSASPGVVESGDDSVMSLYLTPTPPTAVPPPSHHPPALPPSSSLSLLDPSVHVQEGMALLPSEERSVLEFSGITASEEMMTPVFEQAAREEVSIVEKDEGRTPRKESSLCSDGLSEPGKVSSDECHAFIDTSFQQEMETALKEDREARSGGTSEGQPTTVLENPDTVRMTPSCETLPTLDAKTKLKKTDVGRVEPPDSASVTEAEREACSELSSAPTSISDFETLVDTTSERKPQTDSSATTAKDPEGKEAAVSSSPAQSCCGSKSAADQKKGLGLPPQSRSEVTPLVAVACPAISMASSEFLITSSFSDVSSCQNFHSPLGEVYENFTFSSQEDLADSRTQMIVDGTKHCEEGSQDMPVGSISAEEKSVISALEQAIRSASSFGLLSEGDAPLMGEEDGGLKGQHPSSALYSVQAAGLSPAHLARQESLSEDEGLYESVVETDWRAPPKLQQVSEEIPAQLQLNPHAEALRNRVDLYGGGRTQGEPDCQGVMMSGANLVESSADLPPPPPPPPTDPVTGVMLKPPVFLIAPYSQRSREKDREESSPTKEGMTTGDEGKRSFRGFDMVRSMLHLSNRARNSGQKSGTKPAKSVDYGSPEQASSRQEDLKKHKRFSSEKYAATDSKSMRIEGSDQSALWSPACDDSKETPKKSLEQQDSSQKGDDAGRCRPVSDSVWHQGPSSSPKGFRSGPAGGGVPTEETTQTYTGACPKFSGGSSTGSQNSGHGDGGNTAPPKEGDSQQVSSSFSWAHFPTSSPALTPDSLTSAPQLTWPEAKSVEPEAQQKSSAVGSSSGVTPGSQRGVSSSSGPKSSGQSLNPLAPPFMMPASATTPKPGSGSVASPNFSTPSSITLQPVSDDFSHNSDMNPMQTGLPQTKADQTASFYTDSQQSLLSRAFSAQTPAPTTDGKREESFPLSHLQMSGNSHFMSALQDAFRSRRYQNSHQQPPGLNKRFPRASLVQQGWHTSEPSLLSYSPVHSRLQEGWGQGHGGDVAVRTPPALPTPMHKSLAMVEVARSGVAHPKTAINLSPHLKMSKYGEGDVVRQLPMSPLAKEPVVTAAEIHRPSSVQSKSQKVGMRTFSPQITSAGKTADASFDLDTAREVWRKAWRDSSIPDSSTTQDRPESENKDSSVQTSEITCEQASMNDAARPSKDSSPGGGGVETKKVPVYENIPYPQPKNGSPPSAKGRKSEKEENIDMRGKSSSSDSSESAQLKKNPSYENVEQVEKTSAFPDPDESESKGVVKADPTTTEFNNAQDESLLGKNCHVDEHPSLTSPGVVENSGSEDLGLGERPSLKPSGVGSQKQLVEERDSQVSETNTDDIEDSVVLINQQKILPSPAQHVEDPTSSQNDPEAASDKKALRNEKEQGQCLERTDAVPCETDVDPAQVDQKILSEDSAHIVGDAENADKSEREMQTIQSVENVQPRSDADIKSAADSRDASKNLGDNTDSRPSVPDERLVKSGNAEVPEESRDETVFTKVGLQTSAASKESEGHVLPAGVDDVISHQQSLEKSPFPTQGCNQPPASAESCDKHPVDVEADDKHTVDVEADGKPGISVETNDKPAVSMESDDKPVVTMESKPAVSMESKPVVTMESDDKPVVSMESKPVVTMESDDKPVVTMESKPAVSMESKPAVTMESDNPAVTMESDQPAVTMESDKPAVSMESDKPAVSMESDKPAVSMESDKPAVTMESDKPAITMESDQPAVSMESDKPAVSMESDQPFLSENPVNEMFISSMVVRNAEDRCFQVKTEENLDPMKNSEEQQRSNPKYASNNAGVVTQQLEHPDAARDGSEAPRHSRSPACTIPQQTVPLAPNDNDTFIEAWQEDAASYSALQDISSRLGETCHSDNHRQGNNDTHQTVEKSYHISDGFETLQEGREVDHRQGLDRWEVKTSTTAGSMTLSGGSGANSDPPARPGSHESGQSSEQESGSRDVMREIRTRRTHSLASLMDHRASELTHTSDSSSDTGLLQHHSRSATTSRSQGYTEEDASAMLNQNSATGSHSGRVHSGTESVDVRSCDSAISALWEAGEGGSRNGSVGADTSSDMNLACDSGISNTEVAHSSTELRTEEEDRPADAESAAAQDLALQPQGANDAEAAIARNLALPLPDGSQAASISRVSLLQQEQTESLASTSLQGNSASDSASRGCADIHVEHNLFDPSGQPGSTECRERKNEALADTDMKEKLEPRNEDEQNKARQQKMDNTERDSVNADEPDRTSVKSIEEIELEPGNEKPNNSCGDSPVVIRKCTELENPVTYVKEEEENSHARGDETQKAGKEGSVGTVVCAWEDNAAHTVCLESSITTTVEETSPSKSADSHSKLLPPGQTTQTRASQTEDLNRDVTEECTILPSCGAAPDVSECADVEVTNLFARTSDPGKETGTQDGEDFTNLKLQDGRRGVADVVTQTDPLDKVEDGCNSAQHNHLHVLVVDSRKSQAADTVQDSTENATSVNLNTATEEDQKVEWNQRTAGQEQMSEPGPDTKEKDNHPGCEYDRDLMKTGLGLAESSRVGVLEEMALNKKKNDTGCRNAENLSPTEHGLSCETTNVEEEANQNHISAGTKEETSFCDGTEEEMTRDADKKDHSQKSEETQQVDKEMKSTQTKRKFHNGNVSKTTAENSGSANDKGAAPEQESEENGKLSTAQKDGQDGKQTLHMSELDSHVCLPATNKGMYAHQDDSTLVEDSFINKEDSAPKAVTAAQCDSRQRKEDSSHEDHSFLQDVSARKEEDSAPKAVTAAQSDSRPKKEDPPCKESGSEGEGSEGFEVSGLAEGDSLQMTEEETWEVVETRQDCAELMGAVQIQTKAHSAQNGPESPGVSEGDNVYEVPLRGGEEEEDSDDDDSGAVYHSPPSNRPVCEPPPSTLYQVEATHAYAGEDIDELNFDPGDIIYVVPFENEDEQDDGWQLGIKQRDGLKGVFPENFTRRL
ncbi:hypothetical protein ACOMHN_061878 [Nucella lapillus]